MIGIKKLMVEYTAWELCGSCNGSGISMGIWDIETCYWCKGDCVVRVRDEKGRFTKKLVKPA